MLVFTWFRCKDRDCSCGDGCACDEDGRDGHESNEEFIEGSESVEDDAEGDDCDEDHRGDECGSFDDTECEERDLEGDDDQPMGGGAADDQKDTSRLVEVWAPSVVEN